MIGSYTTTTLQFNETLCTGCGMCAVVCPHRVFAMTGNAAVLTRPEGCMECGACQRNCLPLETQELRTQRHNACIKGLVPWGLSFGKAPGSCLGAREGTFGGLCWPLALFPDSGEKLPGPLQ